MSQSNLEFRKIKSLKFLYEISLDGKHIRNVKSKKEIKIEPRVFLEQKHYYAFFPNGTVYMVEDLLEEVLHYKPISYHVLDEKNMLLFVCERKKHLADYLETHTEISRKRIKDRIKERRHYIGKYKIKYYF